MDKVEIFCDGACEGNPGPGGYGAIIRIDGIDQEISGGASFTTNNKMEMMAAIASLEKLPKSCQVVLTSDSLYLIKGMNEWISGWRRRGWMTVSGTPVKNRELWEKLIELDEKHDINWDWIKGHAGHPENERCDALARSAIEKMRFIRLMRSF